MSMKRIKELRDQRNTLAAEVRNVMDQNPGASWKPEHQATYDTKLSEIERIDAEIVRLQKIEDLSAERSFENMGGQTHTGPLGGEAVQAGKHRTLLNKWLRGGDRALNQDDWAEVRALAIRAAMSTGVDTEGGYTTADEVTTELIKAMKAFGGMRNTATVFGTSHGNAMNWPTMDDTGNTGELVPENVSANDQDPSFGTVAMNTYKFSSKVVTVPMELLQDTQINLEAVILELLAERLARAQNTYFTTGTGTAQPRGIVTGAGLGKAGTTGQTTTVTYDDLVDLQHSIDPAYRSGLGWMMNDATIKVIRKIKDLDGRPIFVPAVGAGNVPGAALPTLLNDPINVNQDIAVMAANAKSILYGRLRNYRIRDVMATQLFRFTDSVYTKKGQVGFLAWQRAGGNLLDNSGATVKYYQNSAS